MINLKPIKPKRVEYQHEDNSSRFYNSLSWKRLRNYYYTRHPICEECIKHGKVNPTSDIHHKVFWDRLNTEEEKWKYFLDENNLMSLCESCHYGIHKKAKRYNLIQCSDLTEKEYLEAHNEIINNERF